MKTLFNIKIARLKLNNILNDNSGSAFVEFAIMLPIFLIMIFGIYYLGDTALIRITEREAMEYVSYYPGLQVTSDVEELFAEYEGEILAFADDDNAGENYSYENFYDTMNRAAYRVEVRYGFDPFGEFEPEVIERYVLGVGYGTFTSARGYSDYSAYMMNYYFTRTDEYLNFSFEPFYAQYEDVQLPLKEIENEFKGLTLGQTLRVIEGEPHPVMNIISLIYGGASVLPMIDDGTQPFWKQQ